MEESLKHAEDIENIGHMLSRFGEEPPRRKDSFEEMEEQCQISSRFGESEQRKKDSFEMMEEQCQLSMRESPKGYVYLYKGFFNLYRKFNISFLVLMHQFLSS